ncbi:MAG: hypothetical protein ACI8UO_004459 [Verrucomicrobiales bacterium]
MKHLATFGTLLLTVFLGACTSNSLNLQNPLSNLDFDLEIPFIGNHEPVSESDPLDPTTETGIDPLASTAAVSQPAFSMRAGGETNELPFAWNEVESR